MTTRRYLALLGLIGGVLLLALLPWGVDALDVSGAPQKAELVRISAEDLPFGTLASQPSVVCTVGFTTTDSPPFNNHTLDTAATVANYTGQSLLTRNVNYSDFGTGTVDVATRSDFYRLDNARVNYRYTVQAQPDRTTNYNLGIIVYDRDRQPIFTHTDTSTYSAIITFEALNEGPYYFEVFQASAQCEGRTYALVYSPPVPPTSTPTPTSTPLPGPTNTPIPPATWPSGFDDCEPNYDFGTACTIAPGVTYRFNFVPWGGATVDNDFFRIRVKPGLQLTCETSNLDPGVDPRMVFYNGPGEQYFLMANDDIALGNFNSRLSYYANYEGWLYILVGQGDRMELRDTVQSAYSFRCELTMPGVPATPAPEKAPSTPPPAAAPAATPTPQPPVSPIATPTLPPDTEGARELGFRLVTTPAPPTRTPAPTGFRTFRVIVYYDANNDGLAGAGEGVPGFFVTVHSPETRAELARGYTDDQGQVSFTVSTVGTVRVLIPLLGFNRLVEAARPEVSVRIAPPALPGVIP